MSATNDSYSQDMANAQRDLLRAVLQPATTPEEIEAKFDAVEAANDHFDSLGSQ